MFDILECDLVHLAFRCMFRIDVITQSSTKNRALKFGQEYISEIGLNPSRMITANTICQLADMGFAIYLVNDFDSKFKMCLEGRTSALTLRNQSEFFGI